MSTSIATTVAVCLDQFDQICTAICLPGSQLLELCETVQDERDRFSIYVHNIGAHQTDKRSLNYRLRDASYILDQLAALLQSIHESLKEALDIVKDQDVHFPTLSKQDGIDPVAECKDLFSLITRIVTCLLRLSITIQNPAPYDRFALSPLTDTSHYEAYDIQHTATKYPLCSKALVERLSKANSYRRQYFKYRETRHSKMASASNVDFDGQSTEASAIPEGLKENQAQESLPVLDEDKISDSGLTQTSYASSASGSGRPRVPPLPAASEGEVFECPFCFMLVSAHTRLSWKKHVFADLRPYVCLFDDCRMPMKNFDHRRAWIEHGRQEHLRVWFCPASCGDLRWVILRHVTSRLQKHMFASHPDFQPPGGLSPELMHASSRIRKDWVVVPCPFCLVEIGSEKEYKRHVGRHQEDLSLFALPPCEYPTMDPGHQLKAPGESTGSETEEEEQERGKKLVYQSFPMYRLRRDKLENALTHLFPEHERPLIETISSNYVAGLPRQLTQEEEGIILRLRGQ